MGGLAYNNIQGDNIRDTQSFSGVASIILSGSFNIKILIGVWLCYRRPSQIRVFLSWKIESLNCYITIVRTYYKKDSYCKRWTCRLDIE